MKIDSYKSVLPFFPIIYALSLLKAFESISFLFKIVLVFSIIMPVLANMLRERSNVSDRWLLATCLFILLLFFSVQLALAFISSFWLAQHFRHSNTSLVKSAYYLLFFVVLHIFLVKVGLVNNELIQVDEELGRSRYDMGFKYVTTLSVLSIYCSIIFFVFSKRKYLLISFMTSVILMFETGTRSGAFYSLLLLFFSFFPFFMKMRFNYILVLSVLVLLSIVVYEWLGFEYLNFILSDRLRQNMELFSTFTYSPFGSLTSDFVFLNILAKCGVLGGPIILFWFFLSANCSFNMTGGKLLVMLLAFLTDSGGTIFSIMLMLSFIDCPIRLNKYE